MRKPIMSMWSSRPTAIRRMCAINSKRGAPGNLSDAAGLTEIVAEGAGRRRWFTESGDAEVIDTEEYLRNAIDM